MNRNNQQPIFENRPEKFMTKLKVYRFLKNSN